MKVERRMLKVIIALIGISISATQILAAKILQTKFIGLPESGLDLLTTGQYEAVLTNTTDIPVLVVVVRWRFPGHSRVADREYVEWNERIDPIVKPKSSIPVSIFDFQDSKELLDLGISPIASIVGAIFADGKVVGSDPKRMVNELQGKWRAQREVFGEIGSQLETHKLSATFKKIEEKLAQSKNDPDSAYRIYLQAIWRELSAMREKLGDEFTETYLRNRVSAQPKELSLKY